MAGYENWVRYRLTGLGLGTALLWVRMGNVRGDGSYPNDQTISGRQIAYSVQKRVGRGTANEIRYPLK